MREHRNILGWLGMESGRLVMDEAKKHVEETCKTVNYFAQAIEAYITGDVNRKTIAIEAVRESEHLADRIKSEMVAMLSESVFMPPARQDLMMFVKSLDKIADCTNSSARLLGFIEEKFPDNILKNISAATELILHAIGKLKESIDALIKNELKNVLEDCNEVERFESQADDQKILLIEAIIHSKLEPTSLFLGYQLAEYMEGITDKIEDASDLIKILAAKSK